MYKMSFTSMLAARSESTTPRNFLPSGERCDGPDIDIEQLTEQAVANANEKLQGLCLNCLKQGKDTKETSNCGNRQVCKG